MIDNIDYKLNCKDCALEYITQTGGYIQSNWVLPDGSIKIYPIKKKDKNVEIKVTENKAMISNSLHKYFNIYRYGQYGEHNYNDFNFFDVQESLDLLQNSFLNLDLNDGMISSLEFGFNLITEKPPKYYLDYNFLLYKHKAPVINKGTNSMNYKKFEHCNIAFKVYDKKTQYSLSQNVLRIEIVFKSRELQKLGISYLSDLRKRESFIILFDNFMRHFEGFTIVDNRYENQDFEKKFIDDLGNRLEPSYWKIHRGKTNINRLKNRLRDIIVENKLNNTELYFEKLIKDKFQELFYCENLHINVC
ncbi:hypothetical protein [Epilithonimonas zeae]|uniref:hypothetical protein n=1 Tax=Epilithonimonas zeae TaxID=1416779 RepID=UPI00200EAD9C|nr:hypothetical protein [Epilithonimonas zeae]UQB69452.1 hypothetical protein KI430_03215 [Epilithonimonas zeae]